MAAETNKDGTETVEADSFPISESPPARTPEGPVTAEDFPEVQIVRKGDLAAQVEETRGLSSPKRIRRLKGLIQEALLRDISDVFDILDKAKELARGGDRDMIKLLVTPFLKEAAKAQTEGAEGGGSGKIQVNITMYRGDNERDSGSIVIDQE